MESKCKLLLQRISAGNPFQQHYIARMEKKETLHIDETLLSCLIDFWNSKGMSVQTMADAYLEFVRDAMAEQIYFKKYHQYKNRKYSDICSTNYGNSGYMEKYLAALEISDCLWENHLEIRSWYSRRLEKIGSCRQFVEIGCGGGLNLVPAFRRFREMHYIAVDVSEKAIEVCRDFFGWACDKGIIKSGSLEAVCMDVFEWTNQTVPDVLGMFEVLEHVPNPRQLLQRLLEIAGQDTVLFVSTVINSPMPDHIYLFRSQDEVKSMVEAAGFAITACCCAPANGLSLEQAEKSENPITIALELRRKNSDVR